MADGLCCPGVVVTGGGAGTGFDGVPNVVAPGPTRTTVGPVDGPDVGGNGVTVTVRFGLA